MRNLRSSGPGVKSAGQWWSPATLHLLLELVKRDVRSRFAGSALGLAWAVLQPLSLVMLYWFVFTVMMPAGFGFRTGSYAWFLIAGLLPWIGFQEGITRSATTLTDNAPLVRQLAFRNEVLIVVPNLSALLFEIVALSLFTIWLALRGTLSPFLWLVPFCLLVQFALQLGVGCLLATLHLFSRDIVQVLGFLLSVVFYLTPIIYPVTPRYDALLWWNPIAPLVGLFRSALLGAPLPAGQSIVLLLSVAAALLLAGLLLFRNVQPEIADLV